MKLSHPRALVLAASLLMLLVLGLAPAHTAEDKDKEKAADPRGLATDTEAGEQLQVAADPRGGYTAPTPAATTAPRPLALSISRVAVRSNRFLAALVCQLHINYSCFRGRARNWILSEETMSSAPPPMSNPGYPAQPAQPPAVPVAPAAPANAPAQAPAPAPRQTAQQPASPGHLRHGQEELRISSHSTFFYWWPVWVTGYVMAVLTYLHGQKVQIGDSVVWMDHSKNLGVLFTLIFFLVILITNVSLRGTASVIAILAAAFGALLLAYYGWWESVLRWMGEVSIYMNMGFYVFFSTLVFIVWAFSVFVYDRLSYWRVTPGQLTYDAVIGGAQKSYDTRGMVFEKHRQDLFRHWVLGLGSGDVQISTTGARRETFSIPNVLFVDSRISEVQKMIAMQPDQFQAPAA